MAFDSNNFNVAKKKMLTSSEFSVECTIPTEGDISKIFTVSADVSVGTKEVLTGSISYSGEIETCIVYMTEEGEVGSVHASCPFTSRFEDQNISANDKAVIRARIVDYTIGTISQDSVAVTYRIEQCGFVVSNEEIKSVTTSEDSIAVREEEMKVVRLVGEAGTSICADIPLTTREPIKKLLLCESQASIKDIETGLNFVAVSGEIVSRLLYLTENDRFETAYIFDSFKEEVELEGATREAQAEASVFVRYSDVKAVVDNEEKGAKITVTVPVDVCVLAYEEVDVNVVADLYSTSHEMEVATQSFSMSRNLPLEVIEGKIEGTLVIEDESPRVDKVLFSAGNSVNITNLYVEDGNVNVEGIAKTNVVYLNDETSSLNSVLIEVPFKLTDRVDIPDGAEISAYAVITDVDVAVKKGRELFYDAKVKVIISVTQDQISAVISDATITDELAERDYAMEIVFGKSGQSSWAIAKANRVKESMLSIQNPDVVFPLAENTELVLFHQNANKKQQN